MSNANDNTYPRSKRLRSKSSDDISSPGDNWLSVVLKEDEVDPRIDTWHLHFQDSHVSHPTQHYSEILFNTPFIFKSVNPAKNLVNGVESSSSQRRQEPFTSNLSSFSTNFLSEDLVGKVIEVLGVLLEEVKSDIWRTIINVNQDHLIPTSFIREFNKLVNDSSYPQPNNTKAPFIKCVEEFRSFISRMHFPYPLSPDVELFRNPLNFYCQMTFFITVVHILFDTVVMDFLSKKNEDISVRRLSVDNFMGIFHDFLKRNDQIPPNASDNLEAFTWYHRSVVRSQPQYQYDLSVRFHSLAIHLITLEPIESILSILYTKHFLNVLAKEQQIDHGQFYTPREVMRFMWDRVLIGKGNGTWTEKLLGQNMGIGLFLCEFISRLTLATQQCPIVWNNSRAISGLLHRYKDIRHHDYKDFKILPVIASGRSASVRPAYLKNTQLKFAIKIFNKSSTMKEIINEIDLMAMVGFHQNIIRFCGVTKLKDEVNYSLVFEYADGETLREYLKENATTLKWEIQLKFAKEIASAILCLHSKKIIHLDLHSNNILIHRNVIKLADFGNSFLQGSDCHIKACGVIPYMDPKIFENHSYVLTEKSDIYSLGILFWELTSCSSPFDFERKDSITLSLAITRGKREDPIPNTNDEFVKLYQKCWEHEPDKRPDINQVILDLNSIDSERNNVSANCNSAEESEKDFDLLNGDHFLDYYFSNHNC